jgi:hypothetical protein
MKTPRVEDAHFVGRFLQSAQMEFSGRDIRANTAALASGVVRDIAVTFPASGHDSIDPEMTRIRAIFEMDDSDDTEKVADG